jgi:hypothetical protein
MTKKNALASSLVLTLATLGCGAVPSEQDVATSKAELRSDGAPRLAQYEETYFRWAFGDTTLPIDANGNAFEKNVVMMPIPPTPGDGTPGTASVTLSTGDAFMLPLRAAFGTSYRDGTPPDPFEPESAFTSLDIEFSVDGELLVDTSNVTRYFSKFNFEPAIPYDDPVIQAIIWFEGVGLLHAPLPPGEHVLKLDVKDVEPIFGGLFEFHNTWNVTVQAGP